MAKKRKAKLSPTFHALLAVERAHSLLHYLQTEAKKMRKGYYWPIRREEMLNMVSEHVTGLKLAEKELRRLTERTGVRRG